MNFKSDNAFGVHPVVLEKLAQVNEGTQNSYALDTYTDELKSRLSEIFEKEVSIFLTGTGSAANGIALSALTNPYEATLCASDAHINTDEGGGVEFFNPGTKIISSPSMNGKLDPRFIDDQVALAEGLRPHKQKIGSVSITQATECGTVYTIKEIEAICSTAKKHHLGVHMDGARFTNALVSLCCTPAEMTWKAGVDILSFGQTKNGALAAEAIIVFNDTYLKDLDYRHKRAGQLFSKNRFFAAQFLALLEKDQWRKNATHANEMAQQLATVFTSKDLKLAYPVQANEVFVYMPIELATKLYDKGAGFYPWGAADAGLYRFVCSSITKPEDINALECVLA